MEDTKQESPVSEKARLKKLVSSEDLDQLMEVVGIKSWTALITSFVIILIAFAWSIMGAIPIKIQGFGQAQTEAGPYVILAQIQGTVANVFVKTGQTIKENTLIATLNNNALLLDIQLKNDQIKQTENERDLLKTRIQTEDTERKASLQKQIDTAKLTISSTQSRLPFLTKDLEAKIRLQQQGILAPRDVEEAKDALQQAKINIETAQAQIVSYQAQYNQAYRVDEIEAKHASIQSLQADLSRLQLQNKHLEVRADKAGKVLEVLVAPGDPIQAGAEVASLEIPLEKGQSLQFLTCFGAENGELLDVGLATQIEIAGVDPKQYGYLLGKVQFVSPYPVTDDELMAEVKNKEVVAYLKDGNSVVYLAIISIDMDPKTASGYRWSAQKGPPWGLSAGTTGTVYTIVEEKPPILYVIPQQIAPSIFRFLPGRK